MKQTLPSTQLVNLREPRGFTLAHPKFLFPHEGGAMPRRFDSTKVTTFLFRLALLAIVLLLSLACSKNSPSATHSPQIPKTVTVEIPTPSPSGTPVPSLPAPPALVPTATPVPPPSPISTQKPPVTPSLIVSTQSVTASLPTPQPSTYSSNRYWYSIPIPQGWNLDASNEDSVIILEATTGAAIRLSAREVDLTKYPTLNGYVTTIKPLPPIGSSDFRIGSQASFKRGSSLITTIEFGYSYVLDRVGYREMADWYLLGKYLVTVEAIATQQVWQQSSFENVYKALLDALQSFQPTSYTNSDAGYAVSFPSNWITFASSGEDFAARDPSPDGPVLTIQVIPVVGSPSIANYGKDARVANVTITSRQLVYTGRVNPSYLINYTSLDAKTNTSTYGAVLITLNKNNAIWCFITDSPSRWTTVDKDLIDNLFLRVIVQ